jgi:hypothetical protein
VRRPTAARTRGLTLVAVLALAAPASAAFDDAVSAAQRAISLPRSSEGMQASYDAGRNLEDAVYGQAGSLCRLRAALVLAHGLVRRAEGFDRLERPFEESGRRQAAIGSARLRACTTSGHARLRRPVANAVRLPPLMKAAPEGGRDARTSAALARIGRSFPGWAGIWAHDLVTGKTSGWNSDAQFPAASTVKLGVLLAALRNRLDVRRAYDLRAMTTWSSNLAANRLLEQVGGPPAVEMALRRVGARRSTYPQGYRVGTSVGALDVEKPPPSVSGRVTTAHDLGRILYVLHAGALGNVPALRRSGLDRERSAYALSLLLGSRPVGNNIGLVRPWFRPGTPIAQKNGWVHDARHTAAIVYVPAGPRIVVILTYAPNLSLATAQALGRRVVAALR